MLMNEIPMDHLTALVRQRQERLHAEAAAHRLVRAGRPARTVQPLRAWVTRLRVLWRTLDRPPAPERPDDDAAGPGS